MIQPRHIYTSLSFTFLIGGYRYLMRRFPVSDLPLVVVSVAFGIYLGVVSRDWFRRPKIEGVVSANPRRLRVLDL